MKETIGTIFDLVARILDGDAVVERDDVRAELSAGDGFFSLYVATAEPGRRDAERVDSEKLEKRAKCDELRKGFLAYVKGLDKKVFGRACEAFAPGELAKLNDVISREGEDAGKLRKAMDVFRKAVNDAIMEEVLRLKGFMA